jgi:hypothetical protein
MLGWGRNRTSDDRLTSMAPEKLFDASHDGSDVAAPKVMIEAEAAYITQYRTNTGRDPNGPLCGLALSGGGIRSASIALGVMQALAAKGQLQKFDYLSTVSGGGYIGSAVTWFTSRKWNIHGEERKFGTLPEPEPDPKVNPGTGDPTAAVPVFPFGTRGPVTPPAHPLRRPEQLLRYLSHHANYLEPTKGVSIVHPLKGINILAAVAVVLRGIIVNVFIWLTLMTFLFLTAILLAPHYWRLDEEVKIPGLFCLALAVSALMAVLFCAAALVYSLVTGVPPTLTPRFLSSVTSYKARRFIDGFVPLSLVIGAALLLLGLIPTVDYFLRGFVKYIGPSAILGGIATGLWTFWNSRHSGTRAPGFAASLVAPVGAFLILYGTALFAYQLAYAVATGHSSVAALGEGVGWILSALPDPVVAAMHGAARRALVHWQDANPKAVVALFLLACLAALTGRLANLNYTSIHRYYRDRLMESFLPDPESAVDNHCGPAGKSDKTNLADMCNPDEARGPYHLINCNVLLNNSESRVWNLRGGDSFVMAPRYCGSSATGWVETAGWMKDPMSLATAMAISGAAANPGTGTGGVGPMRDQLVAILMSMLNLRLGCWLPNPRYGTRAVTPNHFHPGLTEMLGWGRREDSEILQLTDGGHFDNLGLYELIRRKVRLIVVSDGTADPKFAFGDLLILLPRLREDFGATITFDRSAGSTEFDPGKKPAPLDLTLPRLDPVAVPRYPAGVALAHCGYAVADIAYADGTKGTLIYLKAAVIDTMDLELLGYKGKTPDFPNESTLDQFYSEEKFEVHRSVGFALAQQMLKEIENHKHRHESLAMLDDAAPTSGLPRAAE